MEKNEVVGVSFLLRVAGFSLRWRPEMELRHLRNTRSWDADPPCPEQLAGMVQVIGQDVSLTHLWGGALSMSIQEDTLRQTQNMLEGFHFPAVEVFSQRSLKRWQVGLKGTEHWKAEGHKFAVVLVTFPTF